MLAINLKAKPYGIQGYYVGAKQSLAVVILSFFCKDRQYIHDGEYELKNNNN